MKNPSSPIARSVDYENYKSRLSHHPKKKNALSRNKELLCLKNIPLVNKLKSTKWLHLTKN